MSDLSIIVLMPDNAPYDKAYAKALDAIREEEQDKGVKFRNPQLMRIRRSGVVQGVDLDKQGLLALLFEVRLWDLDGGWMKDIVDSNIKALEEDLMSPFLRRDGGEK